MGFFRYLAVFGSAVAPARLFIHAAVLVEPNRSRKIEFPSDLDSKVIERLKIYPGRLLSRGIIKPKRSSKTGASFRKLTIHPHLVVSIASQLDVHL
jgi:hypothetical protein